MVSNEKQNEPCCNYNHILCNPGALRFYPFITSGIFNCEYLKDFKISQIGNQIVNNNDILVSPLIETNDLICCIIDKNRKYDTWLIKQD